MLESPVRVFTGILWWFEDKVGLLLRRSGPSLVFRHIKGMTGGPARLQDFPLFGFATGKNKWLQVTRLSTYSENGLILPQEAPAAREPVAATLRGGVVFKSTPSYTPYM